MFLENYQVIKENGIERFAVIDYSEFQKINEIFSSTENLQNYLDYMHIQEIKKNNEKMFSIQEAKELLGL